MICGEIFPGSAELVDEKTIMGKRKNAARENMADFPAIIPVLLHHQVLYQVREVAALRFLDQASGHDGIEA